MAIVNMNVLFVLYSILYNLYGINHQNEKNIILHETSVVFQSEI